MSRSNKARLGVGLGYRTELRTDILQHFEDIEAIEIISENVSDTGHIPWDELRELAKVFAVIPHGINLSIGAVDCLDDTAYLKQLKSVAKALNPAYVSDHFALTKTRGKDIGQLSPLWRTREQLQIVVRNVQAVQEMLGRPLALENITADFELSGADFGQAEFMNEVVRRTGCGLLVDVANAFITGTNLGFDPAGFLEQIDAKAVWQVHLAGGERWRGRWFDSHSRNIQRQVWDLFARFAPRWTELKAVIIERDQSFGRFSTLLAEVKKARLLWS